MAKTRAKLPKMAAPVVLPEPDLISDAQPADVLVNPPASSGRYRVRSLRPDLPLDIPRDDGMFYHLHSHCNTCSNVPMSPDLQRFIDLKIVSIEEI